MTEASEINKKLEKLALIILATQERAADDVDFWERCRRDPLAAMTDVAGRPLPDDLPIAFYLEEDEPPADTAAFPLPPHPERSLSDDELDEVVGGLSVEIAGTRDKDSLEVHIAQEGVGGTEGPGEPEPEDRERFDDALSGPFDNFPNAPTPIPPGMFPEGQAGPSATPGLGGGMFHEPGQEKWGADGTGHPGYNTQGPDTSETMKQMEEMMKEVRDKLQEMMEAQQQAMNSISRV